VIGRRAADDAAADDNRAGLGGKCGHGWDLILDNA
jgi:hypothetical protein